MSQTDGTAAKPVESIAGRLAWERELRLWSGVVLFVFVTMHLINHALGVFGVGVMEVVQRPRVWLWQSAPGTALLYSCFAVHIVLALKRLARRRFSRMPGDEAVQIVLGLLIPYLLIDHLIGTRVQNLYGYGEGYSKVLWRMWGDPAIKQMMLVLVTWVHGCIGIAQAARSTTWYLRWREVWFAFACLVPTLSLAGFVSAAREVTASG